MRLAKHRLAPALDLVSWSHPDVFLFPNYFRSPVLFGMKSITFIYDLSFELHPQYVDAANRKDLTVATARAARLSSHVVTISENSRRELQTQYDLPPDRITVILPAVDHEIFYPRPAEEINVVKNRYGINGPYVLFTATLEPRKNVKGALQAWSQLPGDIIGAYSMVLVGKPGWLKHETVPWIDKSRAAGCRVIQTGYVRDEELAPLYSGASLFVFPSFYEGFGMPPLEAMACGAPVIVGNNSALPEVVGKLDCAWMRTIPKRYRTRCSRY